MTYLKAIQLVGSLPLPWNILNDSNILIAGASGLIGSCLVEVLMERQQRNYHVFAAGRSMRHMEKLFSRYMTQKGFHLVELDVTVPLQADESFHFIINAASGAAPSEFVQHPVEVMKANLAGVINLMEYGLKHEMKRFLYVSSGEVYGVGDRHSFSEEYSGYVDCTNPRSCYPSSKRAAETLCVSYASEYGADVVIARPCHVYGPHFTERDNRVYAQFIRSVLNGEDIVMKSKGDQYRSWCYVVDCASALFHILLKGKCGHAYNIADPNSTITIRELAEIIARIGGQSVSYENPSELEIMGFNPVKRSVFSVRKIYGLGWMPEGSLEDKITQTIIERRSSFV